MINDIEKKLVGIEQQQNVLLQKVEILYNYGELKVLEELNKLTQLTQSLYDDQKQLNSELQQIKEDIYEINQKTSQHSESDYHVASLILDRL